MNSSQKKQNPTWFLYEVCELTVPYDFIVRGAMRSSSGMQKVLCSMIFLNQKVTNRLWQSAETTSFLHRGGISKVLKDANISVKSATNPSSVFALKVIKTSIFQMPLNPCVLIKNVFQSVNICRQMQSVLFSTWKWKKGIWFAESRWATP